MRNPKKKRKKLNSYATSQYESEKKNKSTSKSSMEPSSLCRSSFHIVPCSITTNQFPSPLDFQVILLKLIPFLKINSPLPWFSSCFMEFSEHDSLFMVVFLSSEIKMVFCRTPVDSSSDLVSRTRKVFLCGVVLEVMGQKSFQHVLEPMLRRVVKEEVETAIHKYVFDIKGNLEEKALPAESRSLQLKFLSTLSLPVFTGTRIEGEDGSAIKIALVDALTDEVVLDAPESSAKVEVVVLEGDFDSDERKTWTLEEFRNNIVRERDGKKPLLTGDVPVFLKKGVGALGEISFTDNSSWTRSRRFRLGARVVGSSDGASIREAKTESFIVRDHRGELYKKHHPPSLFDEVWRLEKIGKDGAFHKRLHFERVKTVKDFLILLNLDPARLRNILGAGMSTKMWDVTVDHAQTCVLDKKIYLYYSLISQHKNGVVFNVVGNILGVYSESQYVPIGKLPEAEKLDAIRMVTEAFQHWDGVISFEDLHSLIGGLFVYNKLSNGTRQKQTRSWHRKR